MSTTELKSNNKKNVGINSFNETTKKYFLNISSAAVVTWHALKPIRYCAPTRLSRTLLYIISTTYTIHKLSRDASSLCVIYIRVKI